MRFVFILVVVLTPWFNSCKYGKQEPIEKIIDSTEMALNIRKEDSTIIIGNNINTWLAKELQDSNALLQNFHLQEYYKNDSLEPEPINPGPTFFKDYESVLKWSPDSNYVLDIGSYGSILVKGADGKKKVEAAEPDSEVSLLQPSQNQKWSLFFVGPSSDIFNGRWVNENNFLILGSFDELGNGKPDTLFWLVSVKDKFYRMYKFRRD